MVKYDLFLLMFAFAEIGFFLMWKRGILVNNQLSQDWNCILLVCALRIDHLTKNLLRTNSDILETNYYFPQTLFSTPKKIHEVLVLNSSLQNLFLGIWNQNLSISCET